MLKRFSPEILLTLAALILLGGMLSGHAIWTQEYRWQQIAAHMLSTKDYWHPYLDGHPYYDKPLTTYWFIAGFAKLNHGVLNLSLLRLPSVIAGVVALSCTYLLGRQLGDRQTGLLAAWFLLTTFYFVFFARVASADMWNVASILLALVWFYHADFQSRRTFWGDLVFFCLLVFSALLKGLVGPAIVFMVLIPSFWRDQLWQRFFNLQSILAFIVAFIFYLLPFYISSHTSATYQENGLVEVFRENVLRFFQPFDHEGPWWTYFLYAPIYCLPWCFLVFFVGWFRSKHNPIISWSVLAVFILLSLSGSRRSYYILPIVPFVMLWLAYQWRQKFRENIRANRCLAWFIGLSYVLLCVNFLVIQPWYFTHHA